jgi:hypothetical protein
MNDAVAIRAAGPNVAMVMAESSTSAPGDVPDAVLDSVQIRGVTKE